MSERDTPRRCPCVKTRGNYVDGSFKQFNCERPNGHAGRCRHRDFGEWEGVSSRLIGFNGKVFRELEFMGGDAWVVPRDNGRRITLRYFHIDDTSGPKVWIYREVTKRDEEERSRAFQKAMWGQ